MKCALITLFILFFVTSCSQAEPLPTEIATIPPTITNTPVPPTSTITLSPTATSTATPTLTPTQTVFQNHCDDSGIVAFGDGDEINVYSGRGEYLQTIEVEVEGEQLVYGILISPDCKTLKYSKIENSQWFVSFGFLQ